MTNIAIIVAAGSGHRFGSGQPKQFVEILGKPLIVHTLERFEACPLIDEIILVLSEMGREEFSRFENSFSKLRKVVIGGDTRAASVWNGIEAVDPSTAGVVAVHDGARPLVSVEEISHTVQLAEKTGAACLVAEVTDTVKEIRGDVIWRTIDRMPLRRALTPQAFRYDILRRAFESASIDEAVTDECYLVERIGVPITVVEGSSRNIKVTRPDDILLAEMFLRQL